MLKHFWALPAVLRLALCSQHSFNVHNDILAYPQYEVVFPDSFAPAQEAAEHLAAQASKHKPTAPDDTSQDLSNQQRDGEFDDPFHEPDPPHHFERMMLRRRPYLCVIPEPPPPAPENTTVTTQEEQQQELMRASENGWELLKGMEGNCIYYAAGWWVYAFCYNENIRQFHPLPPGKGIPIFPPVEDESVHSYILGRFESQQKDRSTSPPSSEAEPEPSQSIDQDVAIQDNANKEVDIVPPSSQLQTRGETNFLVQKLGGGTTCDLTGNERRIEVQFHCNPNSPDRIQMIKETASCVYLMVIHTPRLCNDVAFLPPQTDKPNTISCEEIVEEDEEAQWRAIKAAEEAQFLVQNQAEAVAAAKQKPVIGGIEVGGQKLVGGSPERTIKPSEIVQRIQEQMEAAQRGDANQERFVATLAKSDGKYTSTLSEKEMKKKGFKGSRKDVDKLVNEMNEFAGEGKPWRLDIVKKEDGSLEFRGTAETPEDGKSGSEKEDKDAKGKGKAKRKEKSEDTKVDKPSSDEDDEGSQEEFKRKP